MKKRMRAQLELSLPPPTEAAMNDRAAVVTNSIMMIFSSSLPKLELRRHVEALLRDELAAARREAAADREPGDA
jgi:hypothetical protein